MDTGANCCKRVFLCSVLVYLAARNQRAKVTTNVVCMSPVIQLWWVCENHITNPPINPKSMSPTTSFNSHTKPIFPQPYINPAPDTRQLGIALCPKPTLELFKLANPKLFSLLCLAFPMESPVKAAAYAFPHSWVHLLINLVLPHVALPPSLRNCK